MCGIIGTVGSRDAAERVLTGLENLEYRGYDSAGIAVLEDGQLFVRKRAGKISELRAEFSEDIPNGHVSIGHTRWSTHGPPTDINAHPHTSHSGRVAVVHNGIISNHDTLREQCQDLGYTFQSATDTEVIAHLIDHNLRIGMSGDEAVIAAIEKLEGTYAIGILLNGERGSYVARNGSPLILGIGDDSHYFASDVPAFLEFTDRVVYLHDGDILHIRDSSYEFLEFGGQNTERPVETVEWDAEETGKGRYDHYMQKEIENQPTSLKNTIEGRVNPTEQSIQFDSFPNGTFSKIEEIHLVGCGTSYHAAMYGRQLLNARGIRSQAFRASTYDETIPIDETTLTIGVTQSGETADTLGALRTARRAGGHTFTLTNVVGSTASREADDTIYIRAGPEIGVAATKTFSSQVVSLALLAELYAEEIPGAEPREQLEEFLDAVLQFPHLIKDMLRDSRIDTICRRYHNRDTSFFIGHGLAYPVALEGALKFKEITYQNAEGYPSGELKHGPLALVTSGVPIYAVLTGDPSGDEQTRINASEAQTRGAEIIALGPKGLDLDFADDVIRFPKTHPHLSGLLANVQLQLVAYHSARLLERPIDKPRNLAKSVTVS